MNHELWLRLMGVMAFVLCLAAMPLAALYGYRLWVAVRNLRQRERRSLRW